MAKFKYEIQKANQQIVTGIVEGASIMEASAKVRQLGGYLVKIEPAMSAASVIDKMRNIRIESLPSHKDIMGLTKQLAVMVRAGISIRDALEGIAEQQKNLRFRDILRQCRADVESGNQFSDAIAKNPKVFSLMYVNMVRASEMSGTFAKMLDRIGKYLEEQHETRSMVRGAMIYPAVLFCMSVGAVIFLLTWVLPRFMGVFRGKEQLLPKPTKMLMAMSNFMIAHWPIILVGAVVFIVFIIALNKTKKGRRFLDLLKLKVPILSKMFRAIYIARSLQTMGELVLAGVPMLEVLQITSDIAGNGYYYDMWQKVKNSVKEGNKIVTELNNSPLLPQSVVQMIGSGEDSGRLGEVLEDVSEFYAKELRDTIKAVTALLEPLMIVFMGFVVGFIAMSIILPVFKMSSLAGK
ncbi:MAG TPA: type II secretion system F family protein [Phycisphaerae bacterium]|nr:type II secretion system F family protein [Phycisphaerae bacterium]HPS52514.1 type II secretion system F family protein [Phycisphaerae bacterium]